MWTQKKSLLGLELCEQHDIDEEELVETWTAFSAMHLGYTAPTVVTLQRMEKEFLLKKPGQGRTSTASNNRPSPSQADSQKKGNGAKSTKNLPLPSGYTTPQRTKPGLHDVETSPTYFSPASYSPAIITPSRKPAPEASGSGKVLCELGATSDVDWNGTGSARVTQLPTGCEVLASTQPYMYEPLHVSRAVLCDRTEQFGNRIVTKNKLPDVTPLNEPAAEEVMVVGRVACDAEDSKLTASSVVLVGATEREEVSVSLQKLPSYSLFTGQVVAFKTLNQSGKQLVPTELYSSVFPPEPEQPISLTGQGPLQIVVASGPFTHSDAMTYEPLHALITYVKLHKPQLLILIGPFIEDGHQSVQNGILDSTFESFFYNLLEEMLQNLEGLKVHVVLVASEKDAHHHKVYPTPPYTLPPTYKKSATVTLTMASDPCLLSVDGFVLGITSTDVLMHLGRCEVASQGTDRLGRLASHVLHQATFYPVYPPAPQLSLQLELWEKYAQLPVKPHILILPSDLRSFLKEVEGTIIVNPERLAKGVGSGSFARFEVHQPSTETPFPKCVNAQVMKI
ncbi:hypothetical protein B566_EDAN006409 [Ephemera danica]|nr:hypothetical protein B566_EDAN006409 [Ephemera danica]